MGTPSILIIIPAYNAARSLPELITRVRAAAPDVAMLVVNDGSTDQTARIAEDLKTGLISFAHNRGKGAALRAGFRYAIDAGFDAVITIDADLQHRPEEIPLFLERWDGRSILIGTRRMDTGAMPVGRWLSNNWTSIIVSVFSSRRVRDSQSGYRLIPTSVLRGIPLESDRYDMESELLFKAGALRVPVGEVPVATVYQGAPSHIAPLRDTGRFIRQVWRRIWM